MGHADNKGRVVFFCECDSKGLDLYSLRNIILHESENNIWLYGSNKLNEKYHLLLVVSNSYLNRIAVFSRLRRAQCKQYIDEFVFWFVAFSGRNDKPELPVFFSFFGLL